MIVSAVQPRFPTLFRALLGLGAWMLSTSGAAWAQDAERLRPVLLARSQRVAVGIVLGYRHLEPHERARIELRLDGMRAELSDDGGFAGRIRGEPVETVEAVLALAGEPFAGYQLDAQVVAEEDAGPDFFPSSRPPWVATVSAGGRVTVPLDAEVDDVIFRRCAQEPSAAIEDGALVLTFADDGLRDFCLIDLRGAAGLVDRTFLLVAEEPEPAAEGILYQGREAPCAPWVAVAAAPEPTAQLDVDGRPGARFGPLLVAATRGAASLALYRPVEGASPIELEIPRPECEPEPGRLLPIGRNATGWLRPGEELAAVEGGGGFYELRWLVGSGQARSLTIDPVGAAELWPDPQSHWFGLIELTGPRGRSVLPVRLRGEPVARPILVAGETDLIWVSPSDLPAVESAAVRQQADRYLIPNLAALAPGTVVLVADEADEDLGAGMVGRNGDWIELPRDHLVRLPPWGNPQAAFEQALKRHRITISRGLAFPGGARDCLLQDGLPVMFCYAGQPSHGADRSDFAASGKGIFCPQDRVPDSHGFLGSAPWPSHLLCAAGSLADDRFALDHQAGLEADFVLGRPPGGGQNSAHRLELDHPSLELELPAQTLTLRGGRLLPNSGFQASKLTLRQRRLPQAACQKSPRRIELVPDGATLRSDGGVEFPRFKGSGISLEDLNVGTVARWPAPIAAKDLDAYYPGFVTPSGIGPGDALAAALSRSGSLVLAGSPSAALIGPAFPDYGRGTAANLYPGINLRSMPAALELRFDPVPGTTSFEQTASLQLDPAASGGYLGRGGFTGRLTSEREFSAQYCQVGLKVKSFSQSFLGDAGRASRSEAKIRLTGDAGLQADLSRILLNSCRKPDLQTRQAGQRQLLGPAYTDFWLDQLELCPAGFDSKVQMAAKGRLFVTPFGSPRPRQAGSPREIKGLTDLALLPVVADLDKDGNLLKNKNLLQGSHLPAAFERRHLYELDRLAVPGSGPELEFGGKLILPFFGKTATHGRVTHPKARPASLEASPASAYVKQHKDPAGLDVKTRFASFGKQLATGGSSKVDVQRNWFGLDVDFNDLAYDPGKGTFASSQADELKLAYLLKAEKRIPLLSPTDVSIRLGLQVDASYPTTAAGWLSLGGQIYGDLCRQLSPGSSSDTAKKLCGPARELEKIVGESGALAFLAGVKREAQSYEKASAALTTSLLREIEQQLGQKLSSEVEGALDKVRKKLEKPSAELAAALATDPAARIAKIERACRTGTDARVPHGDFKTQHARIEAALATIQTVAAPCQDLKSLAETLEEVTKALAEVFTTSEGVLEKVEPHLKNLRKVLDQTVKICAGCKGSQGIGGVIALATDYAALHFYNVLDVLVPKNHAKKTAIQEAAKAQKCLVDALVANTEVGDCKLSESTLTQCVVKNFDPNATGDCTCAGQVVGEVRAFATADLHAIEVPDSCKTLFSSQNENLKLLQAALGVPESSLGADATALAREALAPQLVLRAKNVESYAKTFKKVAVVLKPVVEAIDLVLEEYRSVNKGLAVATTAVHKEIVPLAKDAAGMCDAWVGELAKPGSKVLSAAQALTRDLAPLAKASDSTVCDALKDVDLSSHRLPAWTASLEALSDAGSEASFEQLQAATTEHLRSSLRSAFRNSHLLEANRKLSQQLAQLLDQAIGPVGEPVLGWMTALLGAVLDASGKTTTSPTPKQQLFAAGITGEGTFQRSQASAYDVELKRLAMEANLSFAPAQSEKGKKQKETSVPFKLRIGAELERLGKKEAAACASGLGQADLLDLSLSADLPIRFPGVQLPVSFSLGSLLREEKTSGSVAPTGFRGGLTVGGNLKLGTVELRRPGFAFAVGELETYLAARCGMSVQGYALEGAAFIGKYCRPKPIQKLDSRMASQVANCKGLFGGYFRAYGEYPFMPGDCKLRLSAGLGIEMGLFESRKFAGEVDFEAGIKARAVGQAGCVVTACGQIELSGGKQLVAGKEKWRLSGGGWVAGGLGKCEPSGWTSLGKAMQDDWCFVCGAGIGFCVEQGKPSWDYAAGCLDPNLKSPSPCTAKKSSGICPKLGG